MASGKETADDPTAAFHGGLKAESDPDSRIRGLTAAARVAILSVMFMVTEEDAAAVRKAFEQEGELSAAIELRRRFPGITDNARARECARSIAGWSPLPTPPAKVVRLRPRKDKSAS